MKAQSIVFAMAGACFGFIVGWILGTQQATIRPGAAMAAPAQVQQSAPQSATRPVDENLVAQARADSQRNPNDAKPRVTLGNIYYDAGQYDEAARWYEEAARLDPKDVNVSTDLGVTYYYLNQPDRALQQFDHSLSLDPKHLKTLLNQGVVRAFGKQDLQGASASWQKVLDIAPNSEEGRAAKRMLDGVKSGHAEGGAAAPASTPKG